MADMNQFHYRESHFDGTLPLAPNEGHGAPLAALPETYALDVDGLGDDAFRLRWKRELCM